MQYSPKLKKAMIKIKNILIEEDLAGVVVIHTPGNSEYLVKIDPSYSACKMTNTGMRVRATLEDFKGDKKARDKKLADTSNMFKLLSDTCIEAIYPIHSASEQLDAKLGAEHTSGGHTTDTTQNN